MNVCRSKQTLLYNLFDLTQSPQVRLAVIGITRTCNIVETFEKRIKVAVDHIDDFLLAQ